MKAAIWHGKKDVRVEEAALPVISAGKVMIQTAWAGICGSDLHAYHHGMGIPVEHVHPLTGQKAPMTMGHEFSGIVTEVGEGVTGIQPGDRVAIEPLVYCGECEYCKKGHYNQCLSVGFIGLHANGGFAEYVVVEPKMVHKLPENVTLEEGALVEPAAVALHAVRESKLQVGDKVAVFGAGPIGLLTVLAAKAAGASEIVVVDVSQERLEKAKVIGASHIVNAAEVDTVSTILALTDGIDVAYEAAGAQPTFTNALSVTKKGGQVMVIAAFAKPVEIDLFQMMVKETSVAATLAYRHIYPEVIRLIASKQMDVAQVITKKIDLANIVEEGFELLLTDKTQAKILVNTNG
ncbi:2,3-butanediol dehydrogenase [Brevibacillus fortis]|uniref:Butanediol dehydrogenase n=1 Tax=Brevibacillus fortis TaxID=2126352 RepID=A0A2P7VK38_9BACL|nr:2,3-butanediol dehydrogenase [Brevibacillus fortis]PSJ99562.1 butanediol dehydrogenase [Brevibacillus fortis]